MQIKKLGLTPYDKALALMQTLHAEVASTKNHAGYLLVVEHLPTVTMGNRDNAHDLLLSPESLRFKNIDYFKIDRGGSVTVHEPGQCVIYPIFNIFEYKIGVKSYVCGLESAMIDTCAHYGVHAKRDPSNPGIWVNDNKIGAIGIRVHNKVTKHGIAFNINNSLQTFSHIVPCGLKQKGVTSLKKVLFEQNKNVHINFEDATNILVKKVETRLSN